MAELIKFNPETEAIIVDYRLFSEVFNYEGNNRNTYIRFLTKTIPAFIERQKKVKPDFCLLMAEHQARYLVKMLEKDPEVKEILRRYNAFKFIRVFEASEFLTDEQLERVKLTRKEEQAYYIKLMNLIGKGYNQVKFKQMLLTGPKHAIASADGIIDAGLDRVGSYEKELGYIEYKFVEAKDGDIVYIEGQPIKLGTNIATGGEAKIFNLEKDTNQELLAKIYCTSITDEKSNCVKFQYLMKQREKKLDVIFNDPSYQITDEQIVFPLMPIYDDSLNLIGVLMKNVKGYGSEVLQLHSIVKNKQYPFENFNRMDLVTIAQQIIDRVQMLHDRNIIIGDINLRNFLVTGNSSETLKVHLIDLDGCQIPGFPALYETTGYSDPTWNPKEKKPRTKSNDVYALLILLFELFHVAHPFQYVIKQGSGKSLINDFQENMKGRDFPYVSGVRKDKQRWKQPPTKANYIFSHLPESMKNLFIKTFGEEDYRPNIEEVKHCVKGYKDKILRYRDDNRLEFDNFAISRLNRVYFTCSFKECKGQTEYQHIKQILSTLKKNTETYLFCGEHIQWHKNIEKFENKSDISEKEKQEFRQFWLAQVEERNLVEIAEKFFNENPNHAERPVWEAMRLELVKTARPKPVTRPSTKNYDQNNTATVTKPTATPTQVEQSKTTVKQKQPSQTRNTPNSWISKVKNILNI